jgi:hypothetical protein
VDMPLVWGFTDVFRACFSALTGPPSALLRENGPNPKSHAVGRTGLVNLKDSGRSSHKSSDKVQDSA